MRGGLRSACYLVRGGYDDGRVRGGGSGGGQEGRVHLGEEVNA